MMRGFALLRILWLLLVLAHHGEGRSVPHMLDQAPSPKPEPCRWVCNPMNSYHSDCIPMPILVQAEATTDSIASTSAPAVYVGDEVDVTAHETEKSAELAQTDGASVHAPAPCSWACDAENNYQCECVPTHPAAGAAQYDPDFQAEEVLATTDSSSTTTAAAATTVGVPKAVGGELRRIFGIPGTVLGRTLLQEGPGWSPGVITTLEPMTSVQVLCKRADALVEDDPWWLKVHVWWTGEEGWVADFWVLCRHSSGNCRVPFCVD